MLRIDDDRANRLVGGVILLPFSRKFLVPLLACALAAPVALAQTGTTTITRDDQLLLVAPSSNGQTGLFTVVTGDTLRRGDVSFGIYYQGWNLEAGPAPLALRPLSARPYKDMSYDLWRLDASLGYGLTDRWEISAMVPYDRVEGQGGDRVGFVNGWLYSGRFSDSGMGDLHLATKFGLLPPGGPTRVALSLFTDLPTGSKDSGISTGGTNFGVGIDWTHGVGTVGASYTAVGNRRASRTNFGSGDMTMPNEIAVDGGLNIPVGWWRTTNWISEATAKFYTGGEVRPKTPVFLDTGLRHWFGASGWAINGGVRLAAAKFSRDHSECRVTELENCGLTGLVGLSFAPMHLAAVVPPPPPPPAPVPPPPAPAPVPPPEAPPVAPPHQPTELRTDEIHFEVGSARLTNIAKAILDDVALRMKQEPTSTALVIGYTDNRENTGPNADLDRRRAEAVRDYLVTRHGIDPSRITVEGRDAREPVGDNATAEGRLSNRRVVIRLIIP
jgi:outer membrane protein OmpA-like peptidoglycan-associated protein